MDAGIRTAEGLALASPFPTSWLGLSTAPPLPPNWANIGILTNVQVQALQAQIAYDQSKWDYTLIQNNRVGRYQFNSRLLEAYGLLATGSNDAYGDDCINYRNCWRPTYVNNGINSYENYFYNINGLNEFLTTPVAQEHLAYQHIVDLYQTGLGATVIKETDTYDVVAGMIYVCWSLGIGSLPTQLTPGGTGAWGWRYFNVGDGANSFNSGRYAVTLSI